MVGWLRKVILHKMPALLVNCGEAVAMLSNMIYSDKIYYSFHRHIPIYQCLAA